MKRSRGLDQGGSAPRDARNIQAPRMGPLRKGTVPIGDKEEEEDERDPEVQDDQGVQGVQHDAQPKEGMMMPAEARPKLRLRPPSQGGHPRAGTRSQRGKRTRPGGGKGPSLPTCTGAGDIRKWLSGGPGSKKSAAESLKEGDSGGQGQ